MSSAMVTSMMTHESSDYEAQQRFSRALKTARRSSVGGAAMKRSNSARMEQRQFQPAVGGKKSPPSTGEENSSFPKSPPSTGEEPPASLRKSPPRSMSGGEKRTSFRKAPPRAESIGDHRGMGNVPSSMNNSERVRPSQKSPPTGYGGELRNARKKGPPRAMSLNDKTARQVFEKSGGSPRHRPAPSHFDHGHGSGGPSPMNRRVDAYRREPGRSGFGNIPRVRSFGSVTPGALSSSYHASRPAILASNLQDMSSSYHGNAMSHHQPRSSAQQRLGGHNSSRDIYRDQQQQNRMNFAPEFADHERNGMSREEQESKHEEGEDYFERKMPVSEPERDANNMIEIFPGHSVPLRTTQETMAAVKRNAYQDSPCVDCGKELFCISSASYCICPSCKSISPLEDRGRVEGMRYGLGLGFTFDTLSRMQEEIVSRR